MDHLTSRDEDEQALKAKCVPLHKRSHGTLLEDEPVSGSRARSTQNGGLRLWVAI